MADIRLMQDAFPIMKALQIMCQHKGCTNPAQMGKGSQSLCSLHKRATDTRPSENKSHTLAKDSRRSATTSKRNAIGLPTVIPTLDSRHKLHKALAAKSKDSREGKQGGSQSSGTSQSRSNCHDDKDSQEEVGGNMRNSRPFKLRKVISMNHHSRLQDLNGSTLARVEISSEANSQKQKATQHQRNAATPAQRDAAACKLLCGVTPTSSEKLALSALAELRQAGTSGGASWCSRLQQQLSCDDFADHEPEEKNPSHALFFRECADPESTNNSPVASHMASGYPLTKRSSQAAGLEDPSLHPADGLASNPEDHLDSVTDDQPSSCSDDALPSENAARLSQTTSKGQQASASSLPTPLSRKVLGSKAFPRPFRTAIQTSAHPLGFIKAHLGKELRRMQGQQEVLEDHVQQLQRSSFKLDQREVDSAKLSGEVPLEGNVLQPLGQNSSRLHAINCPTASLSEGKDEFADHFKAHCAGVSVSCEPVLPRKAAKPVDHCQQENIDPQQQKLSTAAGGEPLKAAVTNAQLCRANTLLRQKNASLVKQKQQLEKLIRDLSLKKFQLETQINVLELVKQQTSRDTALQQAAVDRAVQDKIACRAAHLEKQMQAKLAASRASMESSMHIMLGAKAADMERHNEFQRNQMHADWNRLMAEKAKLEHHWHILQQERAALAQRGSQTIFPASA